MSAALRRKLKGKKPPEGWDLIEEVIEDFEQQMKARYTWWHACTTDTTRW